MRVLNGSSRARVVEGSLNRNHGGWAGLPRQAELIPLIPATPPAAGLAARHGRQVCRRGETARMGPVSHPCGNGVAGRRTRRVRSRL